MTTLPQTTAIRLPRPNGQSQLAAAGGGQTVLAAPGMHAGGGAGANPGLSGSDVWRIIRGHIWLIVFMLVLSGAAGFGVNQLLAMKYPRFTATGFIQVQ